LTGADLQALRIMSGLGLVEFGTLMGYRGNGNTISRKLRRLERRGAKDVPPPVAARARAAVGLTPDGLWPPNGEENEDY
jgi:hypothetical protein